MIRKSLFFVLLFCLVDTISSQSKDDSILKKTTRNTFAEKIYLQLNNTVFTTNEIVWFKAIVTDAKNVPTKFSGVLHVELIDFDKQVVATKKLKLENGIADNFFQLDEKYPSGRYLVRAYTEWNKNFGDDFISKQYINLFRPNRKQEASPIQNIILSKVGTEQYEISAQFFPEFIKTDYKKDLWVYIKADELLDSVEVRPKKGIYKLQYQLQKDAIAVNLRMKLEDTKLKNFKTKVEKTYNKTIAIDKDFIDLQFFPESGKLVDNLTSKLAFKALNYKGLGEEINGVIVDEKDSIILPFKTNTLGMGYMLFTPKLHKIYYGKTISKDGLALKYEIPKTHAEGYNLSVSETQSFINLQVASKTQITDNFRVQVKSKGILLKEFTFQLLDDSYKMSLPKHLLPEGIINITLLDSNKSVLCERLFFHLDEKKHLSISAKPQLDYYTQRDKIQLNFGITNANGEPTIANLSALVIDENQFEQTDQLRGNILSYFLLNSELKGHIENPTRYFDVTNMYRKRDLDALMLTQGWSTYVFSEKDTNKSFDIQPETALRISGKVRSIWNKNKAPKNNVNLTLLTSGKPPGAYIKEVDSTGYFNFDLFDPYGDKLDIVIQSTNKKGKAKEFQLALDPRVPSPRVDYETQEIIELPDSIINTFLEIKTEERQALAGFNLNKNTVELDVVELTGYKVTAEREKIFKLHGPPDIVIDSEELVEVEEKWMSGLYDLLRVKFRDDIFIKTTNRAHVYGTDVTLFYIDGEVVPGVDYSLLPLLPVENVKSVEILKKPKGTFMRHVMEAFPRMSPMAMQQLASSYIGVVSIYTHGGNGIAALDVPKGIYKGSIAGFSTKREFYAPKYETLKPEDWEIPDLRSVIHWVPSMYTDEKGEAQLEFYNDDVVGDKLIIVEAISSDGKIGYFKSKYTVGERKENN
ncbi:hypothetical protein [Hyunsoonleella pacifica]|uniref:Carboxypeptidase regulatory-like domain-containing protein n=1 Tax=Hyunsoonleella pacifica TaxID=1080224 RepID=A0A4Q9FM53_9FLAO|nr:hypothetical protein [Hyunsoonleella pacifica]TBN14740.1 hypothetical protein EYD46_14345 [Hyunsoonleella pacifica]